MRWPHGHAMACRAHKWQVCLAYSYTYTRRCDQRQVAGWGMGRLGCDERALLVHACVCTGHLGTLWQRSFEMCTLVLYTLSHHPHMVCGAACAFFSSCIASGLTFAGHTYTLPPYHATTTHCHTIMPLSPSYSRVSNHAITPCPCLMPNTWLMHAMHHALCLIIVLHV